MQKFERISNILLEQIEKGDFSLSGLPSERVLAERLSANRLTVRKAMVVLEGKGILRKLGNGRYGIVSTPAGTAKNARVALLVPPAFSSGNIRIWYEEILIYATRHSCFLRPFLFVHWNDVSISEILANFDGIFIIPSVEEIPPDTLAKLRSTKGVVMLNSDMSHFDILSVRLFPGVFVRQILDRLARQSHKSIACLHLQTDKNAVLSDRINQWEYWSVLNENDAPLVKADINPFNEGDDFLDAQIKKGKFKDSTAVFCTTIHAAIALIRACKNNGIDPERDLAICTIDDEGIGVHSTPSVGCFKRPDIQKILRPIFNWIQKGGDTDKWKGPLLVEPSRLEIYGGETMHPPAKRKAGEKGSGRYTSGKTKTQVQKFK